MLNKLNQILIQWEWWNDTKGGDDAYYAWIANPSFKNTIIFKFYEIRYDALFYLIEKIEKRVTKSVTLT